jgi:hypothetical protein
MRCGAQISGIPVPALKKGHTIAVLVTSTKGLSFETSKDEAMFEDRASITESTKDAMVADGWTRGWIAEECLTGE